MSWRLLAWRLRLALGPRTAAVLCLLALLALLRPSALGSEGRLIVVGDVHGCAEELSDLLEVVQFNAARDDLFFVGDLIGKGPRPQAVVRLARRMGAKAVQGNHEFNLLRWRKRGAPLPDDQKKITASYFETVAELEEEDWAWLEELPLHLVLPLPNAPTPVVVVHAGLVPGRSLGAQQPYDQVHLRSLDQQGHASEHFEAGGGPWAKSYRGPMQVIFGHDARRGLQQEDFALGLDTGAVYGGSLTCLVLNKAATTALPTPAEALHSVPARRPYVEKSSTNHSVER